MDLLEGFVKLVLQFSIGSSWVFTVEDACASNPCRFGTCVRQRGGYRCNCPVGFQGPQCQCRLHFGAIYFTISALQLVHVETTLARIKAPAAKTLTASHVIVCHGLVVCAANNVRVCFILKYCAVLKHGCMTNNGVSALSTCLSNPCQNGGTCAGDATGYQCICLPGYRGANCQCKRNGVS